MIRLAALNEDESSVSSEEGGVTREALEEIAQQQYARALELARRKPAAARALLAALLDTEGLPAALRYLCRRNLGALAAQLGEPRAAADSYLAAAAEDASDVSLWLRLGDTALRLPDAQLALHAFARGVHANPRHWPCIDRLLTLQLGLAEYHAAVLTLHGALELDPDYLRAKVYRRHIFTEFPYVLEHLAQLNPAYRWSPDLDRDLDPAQSEKLLAEARLINEAYTNQVFENKVSERLPILSLNKPIENWSWFSLGDSLVDMHTHITESLLSHACVVRVSQPQVKLQEDSLTDEPVEDCPQSKAFGAIEEKITAEKVQDEKMEKSMNESAKLDVEVVEGQQQDKESKKGGTRRRGSSLSFLEQWEWCSKRRSSRKKTGARPDQNEAICTTLKRLLPAHLVIQESSPPDTKPKGDDSQDTMDLYKLFKERESEGNAPDQGDREPSKVEYFNSEKEQSEVQDFIQKYVDSTCDIITMLDDFVETMAGFWQNPWPEGLGDIFMEANWCSRQHCDPPLGYDKTPEELASFVNINLIHLEIGINKLIEEQEEKRGNVEFELIDLLKILCSRKESLGDNALNLTVRFLWVKCHSLLYEEKVEFALDCLYYILNELKDLEEEGSAFSLSVPNFSKWPLITKSNCVDLIKSLERNKLLSTVPQLYEAGKYEEAIEIIEESWKHCQQQPEWPLHMLTLLESCWALRRVGATLRAAARVLHAALPEPAAAPAALKALLCLQHVLRLEGCASLQALDSRALAQLLQDLVHLLVTQLDSEPPLGPPPQPNTPAAWIVLHYILQQEEDCGRMNKKPPEDDSQESDIPSSLMILFIAHEHVGKKGWCMMNEGELLYFTLDTVVPRLRSPALAPAVEALTQHLEQCVFCLFGHPTKKTKLRYLVDHGVSPAKLNWEWGQKIFDLFRPEEMPEFNSYRLGSITGEAEQLFQSMLGMAPAGLDPQPHGVEVVAHIEGRRARLPDVTVPLPYKMRDVYYLLADYYLKNNETVKALKYYGYDIVICRDRFDSWAGMALARGSLLEAKLNSCESFRSEKEYLVRANAVEACFKKALERDCSHCMLWIEYGAFVYGVHSFCSRLLKQASESLSMDSFQELESRKEAMLGTAQRCFARAQRQWAPDHQDERWLHCYMLGKIAEKKNEPPSKYLDYYLKASKFLLENNATYPSKINYNNPQNLSVEALEIHYRIHASILKYIEQHENKPIYSSAGKSFEDCLEQCAMGPFASRKKNSKEPCPEKDQCSGLKESDKNNSEDPHILKRSCSDGEESAAKKVKWGDEESNVNKKDETIKDCAEPTATQASTAESKVTSSQPLQPHQDNSEEDTSLKTIVANVSSPLNADQELTSVPKIGEANSEQGVTAEITKIPEIEVQESNTTTSKDNSSSESSSESSSDSTSDSSSDSSQEQEMSSEQIGTIVATCLESLEDCVSRFPQHYKALYRLAHFHFYYRRDKNVARCRDLMLGSFVGRSGAKLPGLFCERKNSNFFNGIWRIPASEVDRAGSFASHMSRCVLITMEVLKEIDDSKTLLDLALHLQRTPDADKKYLRDSERMELAQQAMSLCIRSIKGQLGKFGKELQKFTNVLGKKELSNVMIEVYRSYQRIQKHIPSKAATFAALLIEAYKLYSGKCEVDNALEKSIKKCQAILAGLKQQAAAPLPSPAPTPTPTPVPTPAHASIPIPAPKKRSAIIPATSFLPHEPSFLSPSPRMAMPFLPYPADLLRLLAAGLELPYTPQPRSGQMPQPQSPAPQHRPGQMSQPPAPQLRQSQSPSASQPRPGQPPAPQLRQSQSPSASQPRPGQAPAPQPRPCQAPASLPRPGQTPAPMPMPSPPKTLQQKLAERQKNPDHGMKPPDPPNKTARLAHAIDASEVIVLDDD